ncbi:uncharacterized protein EDB93DRAFT_1256854 [Suillus bovinus]|uniref:uncharacterized protein n=1 Tax=Suillus bovinus TaxID=48563 RepID=UPI001B867D76|nr:uncharacterized protein EDB93DRAFT_1256854 [Suillus bovinus]KAG2127891.1 hypothetical protein EDB93DRAFT_1256854 [Suillus bovinus]
MADGSPNTTFRTLDHDYEIRQLQVFQRMVEQGLIYRHYRPVHYSPSSHSALAEAELVYNDDHVSHSAYVTFPLDSQTKIANIALREVLAKAPSASLLVWTTTPWNLTANMGIAVHFHLLGAQFRSVFSLIHPSGSVSAKIIAAAHVTSESGSGPVHCAPAHGAEDYLAFRSLGLLQGSTDIICHVDDAGKFSLDVAHVVGEEAAAFLASECGVSRSRLYTTPQQIPLSSHPDPSLTYYVFCLNGAWLIGGKVQLKTSLPQSYSPNLQVDLKLDAMARAESMRRIRNSARFILGNIGTTAQRKHFVSVERSELCLAECFVMNELDQIAAEGYANYNFPKVMTSLTNFANLTLSSLYFDITKDCLYANDIQSVERRAVVTILAKVLDSMTSAMAPVLPYLAEEIHTALHEGDEAVSQLSVFAKKWTPVSTEWSDPHAEQDMANSLRMRSAVLSLFEKARGDKHLKSSLEAEVDIILPNNISVQPYLLQLIKREETFLKTLFIVSDVTITDEGSLGTSSFAWFYVSSMDVPDSDFELSIRVRPASSSKCPRCWTYTREEEHDLCPRCEDVVRNVD